MSRVEDALSQFQKGYSCAQAILSTYGVEFDIDPKTALKVSGAFGAGMARMAETCGAVTGAFMVIGLMHASADVVDEDAKEKTYGAVREFADKFTAQNGSIVCKELLGCDIGTDEGMKTAADNELFDIKCTKFVREAAELLEEML